MDPLSGAGASFEPPSGGSFEPLSEPSSEDDDGMEQDEDYEPAAVSPKKAMPKKATPKKATPKKVPSKTKFFCNAAGCTKNYTTNQMLKKHFFIHHADQNDREVIDFRDAIVVARQVYNAESKNSHECDDCTKAFSRTTHLREHMKRKHGKVQDMQNGGVWVKLKD
jgi:hypothetical protein